jgi:hypothetical protein
VSYTDSQEAAADGEFFFLYNFFSFWLLQNTNLYEGSRPSVGEGLGLEGERPRYRLRPGPEQDPNWGEENEVVQK